MRGDEGREAVPSVRDAHHHPLVGKESGTRQTLGKETSGIGRDVCCRAPDLQGGKGENHSHIPHEKG